MMLVGTALYTDKYFSHIFGHKFIEAKWEKHSSVNYAIIGSNSSLLIVLDRAIIWANDGLLIIVILGKT